MRPERWKIFSKNGSNLNTTNDAYIEILYESVAKPEPDSVGYAITDPSGFIDRVEITNGGIYEVENQDVLLNYYFSDFDMFYVDASVFFTDVSIFNPHPNTASTISEIELDQASLYNDVSTYIYPSATYISALFLEPVSTGLIETEHLFIMEKTENGYIAPYDAENSTIVAKMIGDEDSIQLFTLDDSSQDITWSEELVFTIDQYIENSGLQINIGFRSEEEGVYERKLIIYHRINGEDFPIFEFVVNAQSIGQDERFDTLLGNFGSPKPKDIPKLFKEVDINEALPDWKVLNYKAKHMILEHHNIIPYIGTYKGLINAIKWLGYEDIQIKEWFLKVKENKKLSLLVPYDANERKKTIKSFSPEQRRNLKKLNQLSLFYCITRETGEIDEWGNPLTENCYEYNLDEVLIKLFALRKWLEKNIIGVNARIIDITGEGVYFERFRNIIYGTQNQGTHGNLTQSLTPVLVDDSNELVTGEASLGMTLKEFEITRIGDLKCNVIETARYGWDPSGFFSPDEWKHRDPSAVFIGTPFSHPFVDLYDIQWKVSTEKKYGVVTEDFVSNPLFIYDNSIYFYNYFDTSTRFKEEDTNVTITLERGYLRNIDSSIWEDSIMYSIYPDPNTSRWVIESSLGTIWYVNNQVSLQPGTNPKLEYFIEDKFKEGTFAIEGYKWTDASGISTTISDKHYLDVSIGKIAMNIGEQDINNTDDQVRIYDVIDFDYDFSTNIKSIKLNVLKEGARVPLFSYDPDEAEQLYYNPNYILTLIDDNSTYKMIVNHIGKYNVQIRGWDGHNNLFTNFVKEGHDVWMKDPIIHSYILDEQNSLGYYIDSNQLEDIIENNKYPIFDRRTEYDNISFEIDASGYPFIKVPTTADIFKTPEENTFAKFANISDRVYKRDNDEFFSDRKFIDYKEGDTVRLVLFDKGMYHKIKEFDVSVSSVDSSSIIVTPEPSAIYTPDYYNEVYMLNDTKRLIANITNEPSTNTCEVELDSNYEFEVGQMVSIIVSNNGLSWGASYRVIDYSAGVHTLDGLIPEIQNVDLYMKHAFSSYADFEIPIGHYDVSNNNINLYLKDKYFIQNYLDNTFVYANVPIEQNYVISNWYNPDNFYINQNLYAHKNPVEINAGSLLVLDTYYDPSGYVLDKKCIWTIRNKKEKDAWARLYNKKVPYLYEVPGYYDVKIEVYDKFGNLNSKKSEALIYVDEEKSVKTLYYVIENRWMVMGSNPNKHYEDLGSYNVYLKDTSEDDGSWSDDPPIYSHNIGDGNHSACLVNVTVNVYSDNTLIFNVGEFKETSIKPTITRVRDEQYFINIITPLVEDYENI